MKRYLILFIPIFIMSCSTKNPEINLPALISNNMVLQQKAHVVVWGWSEPGLLVKIQTSWGETAKIRTSLDGTWKVSLTTPKAGGPYTMTFKAKNSLKLVEEVMIGEVWLCSGQSNMEMPLAGWPPNDTIAHSKQEIANADFTAIRMFTVDKDLAFSPNKDCSGSWEVCNPASVPKFSAAAFFFGKKLYKELNVPIGLIHSSWGGTPAESWTSNDFLEEVAGFEEIKKDLETSKNNIGEQIKFLEGLEKIDFKNVESMPELSSEECFFSSEQDSLEWEEMEIPGFWENSTLSAFDGIVWLKKTFKTPSNLYPEGFELYLGPIDDMDIVYINGKEIGRNTETGQWQIERRYEIPSSVLKQEENIILIKVIDTGGGGGIHGNIGPGIFKAGKRVVDLSGTWEFIPTAILFNGSMYSFGKGDKAYAASPKMRYSFDSQTPSALYNAMIAPLIPYTLQGVIWYQGEANVRRYEQYKTLFPKLIDCWRDKWEQGDFPFYYVQIAPYNYGNDSIQYASELRNAQLEALKKNNVGMVVTMDIGNPENIHPANKKEVGERLALWALAKTYNQEKIVCSGPLLSNVSFGNGKVKVEFDYAEDGMHFNNDSVSFFEVAGKDQVYHTAHPIIDGEKIYLSTENVNKVRFIRYGWGNDAEPNLFNNNGLPASPFSVKK